MDMSELFKRHLSKLHKGTNLIKTVEDRKEYFLKERKSKRETLAYARRHIDINMSPYNTPLPESKCESKKVITSTATGSNNKRLELLAKWKLEKEKQKHLEKAKRKPIFKVCHVSDNHTVNLENVNKLIKGKAILSSTIKRSQFAPANHKFKPPNGIKPLNFNTPITNNKVSEKSKKTNSNLQKTIGSSQAKIPQPEKEHHKTPKKESGLTQRHLRKERVESETKQVVKPTLSRSGNTSSNIQAVDKTKAKAIPPKASVGSTSKNKQISNASTSQKNVDSKKIVKQPLENSVRVPKKTPTNALKGKMQNKTNKALSKVDSGHEVVVESVVTPTAERLSPVYISPFVTISRGKKDAREEYKVRHSYGKETLKPVTPEMLDAFSAHTSPQAGAHYFMVKLDSEIARLSKICEEWENCLEEPEIPEEARSSIDVAIGQSKLLIDKKFQQFRGLIIQCKTKQYEEKVITCEDLHGFWDMVYMQVEDLDKRFANLHRLKENQWTEMLPEKKVPVKKTRTRAKKTGGTSRLRDMIKAAREKHKTENNDIGEKDKLFNGGYLKVRSPLKEHQVSEIPLTPSNDKRMGLRVSLLTSKSKNRCSSSPGLTMMKISQSIKQGNGLTPAKSILKMDGSKSTGKKSVVFKESVSPKNFKRSLLFGDEEKENTPQALRRSSRLAK